MVSNQGSITITATHDGVIFPILVRNISGTA